MITGGSIFIGAVLIYVGLWYVVIEIRTVTTQLYGIRKEVVAAIDELAGEIRRHD